METFKLTIAEDNKIPFEGQARYCRITTPGGVLGFEPRHEGFAGILMPGSEVEYTDGRGAEHTLSVSWGTFLFEDNVCSIVVATEGK